MFSGSDTEVNVFIDNLENGMQCIFITLLTDIKFGRVVNMLEGRAAANWHHSLADTD